MTFGRRLHYLLICVTKCWMAEANDSTASSGIYYIKMPTLSHYECLSFLILSASFKEIERVDPGEKAKA